MILSHKHKFIFFGNPKKASSSEEQEYNYGLRQAYSHSSTRALLANKHIPPATLKAWLSHKTWDEYYQYKFKYKFVFVSNPWDWFVSTKILDKELLNYGEKI